MTIHFGAVFIGLSLCLMSSVRLCNHLVLFIFPLNRLCSVIVALPGRLLKFIRTEVQSTLVFSTSLISNNHLSRSENLVPYLT